MRPALELHGDSLRQLYNVVFAGCCGVTCNHPAAVHLRRLLHSRPYLSRIPDQSMLVSRTGPLGGYPRACRDRNRSYAMIYVEGGRRDVEVRLAVLSGTVIRAWWYDPHTGESVIHGDYLRAGTLRLTTPVDGDDWVLVLDDRDRNFPSPGINYF